jgi:predicted metal-dependent phosphoesterase TrpH
VRAITHLHTNGSYDSALRVPALLRVLQAHDVELALINDHDSFAGSLEARAIIARKGLRMVVPVAAEIRTELGDVIVAFPSEDVPEASELKEWHSLQKLARGYGALIWLPHPYTGHREVDKLAAGSDVIEVFNSRCKPAENERATELCRKHGRVTAYGADAHLRHEIKWFVEYPVRPDPLDVLRSDPVCREAAPTRSSDVSLSRCIAGFKRRQPGLMMASASRYVQRRVRELGASRA